MTTFQKRLILHSSISAAIITILVIGLVLFGKNITSYGKELSDARQTLALQAVSLERLAGLQTQYKVAEPYVKVLNNVIPKEEDLIDLSRDFQILATKANITHSFSFVGENPASAGSLGSINFRLDAAGKLDNLFSFVKSLEHFRYLTRLDSFTIGRDQEKNSMMTVRGQVFFRGTQ